MKKKKKKKKKNDLGVAHPQSGSSSTRFLIELEFGKVGFFLAGGERSHHCAIPCSPTIETILTQN